MSLTCNDCHIQLPDDAAFCYKCGTAVTIAQETASKETKEKVEENSQAEAIVKELIAEAKEYEGKFLDVGKNQNFLQRRAKEWAEYRIQQFYRSDWMNLIFLLRADNPQRQQELASITERISLMFTIEHRLIKTTEPHKHKALFLEAIINRFIDEVKYRDYIIADTFTEEGMNVIGHSKVPDEMLKVEYPDFSIIRAVAHKDKELFPDPEPIRVEAAGATIRFTSWEAVLVVYMDCVYKEESITIWVDDAYSYKELRASDRISATVVERNHEGTPICAAIFLHIPLVTNYHRYSSNALTTVDCTVTYSSSSKIADTDSVTLSKTMTLTRSEVIYLDWRGK